MLYVLWYFAIGALVVTIEMMAMKKIDPKEFKKFCDSFERNGKFFVVLFIFLGMTAWPLLALETYTNVTLYLEERKKKKS